MRHGSLFSGIGGFDLAAEWMGWENVFHCELNPFGRQVLNYYWSNAESFTDIKQSDFTKYANRIDVLSGGFPCQPYSQAGKRLGKEDERHLWPEMLRAIREIRPGWVVGENVRGLTNWNGGMVFDEVQADLEAQGYEVLPFLLPACAVNAPHRRDRIWFIAYSNSNRNRNNERQDRKTDSLQELNRAAICTGQPIGTDARITTDTERNGNVCNFGGRGNIHNPNRHNQKEEPGRDNLTNGVNCDNNRTTPNSGSLRERPGAEKQGSNERRREQLEGSEQGRNGHDNGIGRNATNTKEQRFQKRDGEQAQHGSYSTIERHNSISRWKDFPTQSPLCSRNDGISTGLSGITFSKHRNESIKAYGNAVVPQIPFEIFKAIELYANQTRKQISLSA